MEASGKYYNQFRLDLIFVGVEFDYIESNFIIKQYSTKVHSLFGTRY